MAGDAMLQDELSPTSTSLSTLVRSARPREWREYTRWRALGWSRSSAEIL